MCPQRELEIRGYECQCHNFHWHNAHVALAWHDPCAHRVDNSFYRTRRGRPRLRAAAGTGTFNRFRSLSNAPQLLHPTWPSLAERTLFTMFTCTSCTDAGSKKGGHWAPTALAAPHADSCPLYIWMGQAETLPPGDPLSTSHHSGGRILLEEGRADIAPGPRVTHICARPRSSGGETSFPLTEVGLPCGLVSNCSIRYASSNFSELLTPKPLSASALSFLILMTQGVKKLRHS